MSFDLSFEKALLAKASAKLSDIYLGSSSSFQSKRDDILDQLALYEDEKPVELAEWIDSDKYCGLQGIATPFTHWLGQIFYYPDRVYEDFKMDYRVFGTTREFVLPGFASLGLTKEQCNNLQFSEMAACIGMRVGKSFAVACFATWEAYKYLCKRNPQAYYRSLGMEISDGTEIYIGCCATSSAQAGDTIWSNIQQRKATNVWFQRYIEKCQEIGRLPSGKDCVVDINDKLAFNHKGLILKSYTTSSKGLVGVARLMAIIDELDQMQQSDGADEATRIYESITTGTTSLEVAGHYESKRISISSPVTLYGKILQLYAKSKYKFEIAKEDYDGVFEPLKEIDGVPIEPVDNILGIHGASWRLRPSRPFSSFANQMKKDPIATMRDYGALPPGAKANFITNTDKLRYTMDYEKTRRFESRTDTDIPDAIYTDPETGDYKLQSYIKFDPRFLHFIHFDPGLGRPSNFGIAVGHAEPVPTNFQFGETEGELPIELRVIHVMSHIDLTLGIEADPFLQEVDHEKVEKFIMNELLPRIKQYRISTDRWQIAQMLQKLRKVGGHITNKVINDKDYHMMKNQMDYGLIDCYFYQRLYDELSRLEIDPKGKVLKGSFFTKDVADCLTGVVCAIIQAGVHQPAPGRHLNVSPYGPSRSPAAGRAMNISGFRR